MVIDWCKDIILLYSDFGLSRNLSKEKGEDLTEYVVTRFYRAPEIMLSSHEVSILSLHY